jgi:hypothetical protein
MGANVAAEAAIWLVLILSLLCYPVAIVLCLRASRRGTEFEATVQFLSLTLKLRTGPANLRAPGAPAPGAQTELDGIEHSVFGLTEHTRQLTEALDPKDQESEGVKA